MNARSPLSPRIASHHAPGITALVRHDAAKRALAEALAVDEVKDILDKAVAIQAYAHQAKDREMEVNAAELRFRSERRLGELLAEGERAKGAAGIGKPKSAVPNEYRTQAPTLSDLGVDKKLSSHAQLSGTAIRPREDDTVQER